MKPLLMLFSALWFIALSNSHYKDVLNEKFKDLPQQQKKKYHSFLKMELEKNLDGSYTSEQLIDSSKQYLGTPHCMGGITKKCMDCSGFVWKVFSDLGISIPHNSQELACYGKIIENNDEIKKGDLVFFYGTYNTANFITHSGIYLGKDTFIHTSLQNGVCIDALQNSNYWSKHFVMATRPKTLIE